MASNLLWAHLLRKNATTTTDTPSQIPPIAPQDRTGTSMRMLIHDTQVNLEKFSTRLDGLLQRVEDCRAQVVNANKLLDVERDKVLTEILEIAHRCQSEMKAHVGTPAQASALDLVHVSQVSTEKSVQALEKRIDALQTLLQTHVHAMQSIQDQQNTLIGAILPLVPVVHGVSPQMDQIKATLSDMIANAVSTITNNVESVRSTLVAELAHGHGCARSSTRIGSSNKSIPSSPRKRSNVSILGPHENNVSVSSPLDSRSCGGPEFSFKRSRIEGPTSRADDVSLPRKLSRLAVPLTDTSDPLLLQTPHTPRQPLADLFFIPGSNHSTSSVQRRTASYTNPSSRGYMRPCRTFHTAGGFGPPISRSSPPRPDMQDRTITRRRATELYDISLAADKPVTRLPNAVGPSDQDALSKAIKIEHILVPDLTGVISVNSSPLSSPPSSLPPATCHGPDETNGTIAQPPMQRHSRRQDDMPDVPLVQLIQDLPPSSDPLRSTSDASPPKSMSLRDRRAQISKFGRTEARRFIPLVPWSDDEE